MTELAESSPQVVIGSLASAAGQRELSITVAQHHAWETTIRVLRTTANELLDHGDGVGWGVILEFELPRRAVRPDAVVLAGDVIVPVEFKVGERAYPRADKMQVEEYARDLRDFHESSHSHPIVPVLVATEATNQDVDLAADPVVDRAQCTGVSRLAELLVEIVTAFSGGGRQLDIRAWSRGRYRPTPGILEAARDVYAGHEVRELSASYADNLGATVDTVRAIIRQARSDSERCVCFVTGVPGSGKTLAGLTAIHEQLAGTRGQALGAYLSGNGPLVEVLRYAIAVDLRKRQNASAGDAARMSSTFIQPVHRFVRELADSTHAPPENVVVFDEAQRAWDERRMALKQDIHASEAAVTLDIMERVAGWSAVIALVGDGQEINDGEAGIGAWFEALANRPSWQVYASSGVSARQSQLADRVAERDALELRVSVRSPRARLISEWAEAVTSGALDRARDLAANCEGFPLLITRDLEEMRAYLWDRSRADRRPGLLASSQARRLRAFGIEMDGTFQGGINWPRWFVDGADDIRSSYALEVAASEFKCQGLEIDWAGLCWGSDFTWNPGEAAWHARRLSGGRWVHDRKWQHAQNRHRVLLTRARYGLVIWVPRVMRDTLLVNAEELDQTAEALTSAGCTPL